MAVKLWTSLSHPDTASMTEVCSFQYSTVAVAARQVLTVGRRVLLAKMDIKNIQQLLRITTCLASQWNGWAFAETVLPFHLRSVHFFTKIADAILCIMRHLGTSLYWRLPLKKCTKCASGCQEHWYHAVSFRTGRSTNRTLLAKLLQSCSWGLRKASCKVYLDSQQTSSEP